jgi:O-antigen/teichoic acid export membrane protein
MDEAEKHNDSSMIIRLVGLYGSRLFSPFFTFLVIVLIARLWGQALFGKYSTVMVWLAIFRTISVFGLGELLSREVGANRNEVLKYLTHGLLFGLFSSVLCALIMIAGAVLFKYPNDVKYGIMIATMILPFHACKTVCQAVLTAFQKTKIISAVWILEDFLFLVVGSAIVFKGYGFINLFWSLVLVRIIASVFNLFIVHKNIVKFRFQIDWDFSRKLSLPLIVFGVTGAAYQIFLRIDVVMLSKLTDMVTVGMYSSAAKLMEFCLILPAVFFFINLPVAARGYENFREQMLLQVEAYAGQLFVLIFFVFGFGFFFAKMILTLVYGPAFAEAEWLLRVLMIAFLVNSADAVLAMTCMASKYLRLVMYISTARAVVNIVLNLIAIPVMGAFGAALATLISIAFSFVAYHIFMGRTLGRLRWISIVRKPALACLFSMLILLPLIGRINTLPQSLAFLMGYGFMLFALNGFSSAKVKLFLHG